MTLTATDLDYKKSPVAERDQGSSGPDGSAPRHGSAELAAGEHRRSRQEI